MSKYAEFEPYQNLANAIIKSAMKDYKRALIHLKRDPDSESAKRGVQEGQKFLYSQWFEMLTDLEPSYIDRRLREIVDQKY